MENRIDCKSDNDYIAAIGNSGDSLVLVEFYSEWSNPSLALSQDLELLVAEFPLIQHIRLNFNDCPVLNK
jgi:thiol-disulfide isomerase/thioredoxin